MSAYEGSKMQEDDELRQKLGAKSTTPARPARKSAEPFRYDQNCKQVAIWFAMYLAKYPAEELTYDEHWDSFCKSDHIFAKNPPSPAAPEPERGEQENKTKIFLTINGQPAIVQSLPDGSINISASVCQPTTSGEEKEVWEVVECDNCGRPWDLMKEKYCECGAVISGPAHMVEKIDRQLKLSEPPPLTGKDLSDTNVGNIVQRAEDQVTGNDVEGEAPGEKMSNQLACEADMAAIEYGKEKNSAIVCECDECGNCWNGGSISADIAEAFEAGQSWMWRKMQEQIAAERKHAKYGLELLSDRCKELETQLSAAPTRISELQRELSLEIDTRKVLSDQLAAEKSFNENSKAMDEKNGMEAEGLKLSIQNLRDAFREQGLTGVADRINGLLTNK